MRREKDIVYPDLSYKIIGIVYKVYNKLGAGYKEKCYQNAIEMELQSNNIFYEREKEYFLFYDGKKMGKYYVDFFVENKIILELKVMKFYNNKVIHLSQVLEYLKVAGIKLGIIVFFTSTGVIYKRIIHPKIGL
jgi:GxxExxY protein